MYLAANDLGKDKIDDYDMRDIINELLEILEDTVDEDVIIKALIDSGIEENIVKLLT